MPRTIRKLYEFKDHDPVLDQIDSLLALAEMTIKRLDELGAATIGTLRSWQVRKTKRPQFATVQRIVRACGGNVEIVYQGKRIRK